jgi:HEPN domain-containing protein
MSDIKLVRDWFQHSYNNLISAKHLFEDLHPKQIEISCYLCQQSAETALKGFLTYKDYDPPKTHDLNILCKYCIKYDSLFETILSYCADLTDYGILPRYPNELEADETDAKAALEKAKIVYEFCLSKIPEEGRPPESPVENNQELSNAKKGGKNLTG